MTRAARIVCPHCGVGGSRPQAPPEGTRVRCPGCKQVFVYGEIPRSPAATPTADKPVPKRASAPEDGLAADLWESEPEHLEAPPSVAVRGRGDRSRMSQSAMPILAVSLVVSLLILAGLYGWSLRQSRLARDELARARKEHQVAVEALEAEKRAVSEQTAAQAELTRERDQAVAGMYRATLGEAQALREARPPGWRDLALGNLAKIATIATPARDLVGLRSDVVACLDGYDLAQVTEFSGPRAIWSSDFSPDGNTLATADYNSGRVDLWDLVQRRNLATMADPGFKPNDRYQSAAPLPAVRFLPDGSGVAYANWSHQVAFLGKPGARAMPPTLDGPAPPRSLAFDRQGKRLAVSWGDGTIAVYDMATGRPIRTVSIPMNRIQPTNGIRAFLPVALSPRGDWLALPGPDNLLLVCEVDSRGQPIVVGKHRGHLRVLAFSPDGSLLASGAADHVVKLWNVRERSELASFHGHGSFINGVAFSPDGALLASVCSQTLCLWDPKTARQLLAYPMGSGSGRSLAFSTDGTRLAVESRVFRLIDDRVVARLPGHTGGVTGVCLPPGEVWFSGTLDREVLAWDRRTNRPVRRWEVFPPGVPIGCMATDDAGAVLATGAGAFFNMAPAEAYHIKLWNPLNGTLRRELVGHAAPVRTLDFSTSGKRLVSGAFDGAAIVWDVESGVALERIRQEQAIEYVAFLGSADRLIVGDESGGVTLHAVGGGGTGKPLARVRVNEGLRSLAVVPGGDRLYAVDGAGNLRVFSLPNLEPIELPGASRFSRLTGLALDATGQWLALSDADHRVTLFDGRSLRGRFAFPAGNLDPRGLEFDRDGTRFAVAVAEEVALWDLAAIRSLLGRQGLDWEAATSTGTGGGGGLPVK